MSRTLNGSRPRHQATTGIDATAGPKAVGDVAAELQVRVHNLRLTAEDSGRMGTEPVPALDVDASTTEDAMAPEAARLSGVGLVRMSEVSPERVEWLWPGRIPRGKLTVLDGAPKVGKSTLALDLAARVTTGQAMPEDDVPGDPAAVVLMTAEDGLADTVRKRLDSAGADCSQVVVLESVPVVDEPGRLVGERPPVLPNDLDHLEEVVTSEGAALVIIDVLTAYLASDVKSHNDQDVRRALMPLARMAERTRAAVLVLRHPRKGGGTALEAGGGSIAISGAARSVLVAAIDPDDDRRRVLAVAACNLAAPVPALAFELEPDAERDSARIVWHGPTDHRADDLTQPSEGGGRARDEAQAFLADLLGDGPVPAQEVYREAEAAGITKATLRRAKDRLGVESVKNGQPGKEGQQWSLGASRSCRRCRRCSGQRGERLRPQRAPSYGRGWACVMRCAPTSTCLTALIRRLSDHRP